MFCVAKIAMAILSFSLLCFIYMDVRCTGVLVFVASPQQATPQCQDVHTESCVHFHDATPDLCSDPTFGDNMCKRFCGNCPLECHSCDHPVRNPQDCNTTAICDPKSQCAIRHLKATDGHHEYLMSCESKELCDLVAFGFGFGKRTIDDMGDLAIEGQSRSERNVMMSCCDSDLCNIASATAPTITTTTTQTTTTQTTTTIMATYTTATNIYTTTSPNIVQTTTSSGACAKDVVFVMQNHLKRSSHSATGSPTAWVSFARQLAAQINVGPNQTHVAAVIYDSNVKTQWYLDRYTTDAEIHSAISHLASVQTHGAWVFVWRPDTVLTTVSNTILTSAHGDRPDADNVVVLLDNGGLNFNNHGRLTTAVSALHAKSDKVVIVSVGAAPDANHHGIATDGSHQFYTSGYGGLTALLPKIASLICS